MAKDYFEFKQFKVFHGQCAMKVGTDAVLLGSWAKTTAADKSILDIGTGSGIISLMLAQRAQSAHIDAIDIDDSAYLQAKANFESSPWSERLQAYRIDFTQYMDNTQLDRKYDLIVSNPPYFTNGILAPCNKRSTARHINSLNYQQLFKGVVHFLNKNGRFALILPYDAEKEIETLANSFDLYLRRKCFVYPKPDGVIKRLMWEFSPEEGDIHEEHLTIEMSRHVYTPEYIALTKDYYLKM
ncbi:MAG: tRNA1(Val) (adenine(37)-N6)-methyltransferase [Bacteroidales bacterium]